MKKLLYQFLMLFTTLSMFGIGEVVAQSYCTANHRFGCQYNSGNSRRYAAINTLNINQGGVQIYSKSPDGCNQAPSGFGPRPARIRAYRGKGVGRRGVFLPYL